MLLEYGGQKVMRLVMPLASVEEEPFDSEDEELGVRGSELEAQADHPGRGVQKAQGKGLHLQVALIDIRHLALI